MVSVSYRALNKNVYSNKDATYVRAESAKRCLTQDLLVVFDADPQNVLLFSVVVQQLSWVIF